jgi:hypothetical protein
MNTLTNIKKRLYHMKDMAQPFLLYGSISRLASAILAKDHATTGEKAEVR